VAAIGVRTNAKSRVAVIVNNTRFFLGITELLVVEHWLLPAAVTLRAPYEFLIPAC
jgi:hypothetical protein